MTNSRGGVLKWQSMVSGLLLAIFLIGAKLVSPKTKSTLREKARQSSGSDRDAVPERPRASADAQATAPPALTRVELAPAPVHSPAIYVMRESGSAPYPSDAEE